MLIVSLGMFIAQAVAFIDALTQPKEAYVAGDKLTKQAWCIILGLAVVAHMLIWNPLSLFNLVGIVAAIVYLVDVRPTLRSLTRR
jgi:hypothetical protein